MLISKVFLHTRRIIWKYKFHWPGTLKCIDFKYCFAFTIMLEHLTDYWADICSTSSEILSYLGKKVCCLHHPSYPVRQTKHFTTSPLRLCGQNVDVVKTDKYIKSFSHHRQNVCLSHFVSYSFSFSLNFREAKYFDIKYMYEDTSKQNFIKWCQYASFRF